MLKKIDKHIATSFIGPTILSYFIATFVLVMQLLWKYIDDILGKGFTIIEILELIFYYSVTLIPLAVPITILLASVMVFGDMSEKYELSSMKSAGVSLVRIMLPGFTIALFIGFYSFFASNFLKPAANFQFQKRLIALRKQKSALAIEEGIFNDAFGETVLRINNIDDDGRGIHNVLMYDHTQNDKSLVSMLTAKGGEMYTMDEGRYFVMQLDSGVQYRELERKFKPGTNKSEMPFTRTYFDEWTKKFDMSIFDDNSSSQFNRNREDMMHAGQLLTAIDTFQYHLRRNSDKFDLTIGRLFGPDTSQIVIPKDTMASTTLSSQNPASPNQVVDSSVSPASQSNAASTPAQLNGVAQNSPASKDSLRRVKDQLVAKYQSRQGQKISPTQSINKYKPVKEVMAEAAVSKEYKPSYQLKNRDAKKLLDAVDAKDQEPLLTESINKLSNDRDELLTLKNVSFDYNRINQKHLLRLNQQFSWAMICVIFLFIGAPLGSIIRKGGYGYPMLVAILFYMIFIITTIFGEKLVKNGTMGGIQAAWLPCILLTPFAILLTIMALRDMRFHFLWLNNFKRFLPTKSKDLDHSNL